MEYKSAENILQVFLSWAVSLGVEPTDISILTDRGGEFNLLSDILKKHCRTAAYSPYSNGKLERVQKKLAAMCRLHATTPDQIAELWSGRKLVNVSIADSASFTPGTLVLRYIQKLQTKTMDCWTGRYVIQTLIGNRMVKAFESRYFAYLGSSL